MCDCPFYYIACIAIRFSALFWENEVFEHPCEECKMPLVAGGCQFVCSECGERDCSARWIEMDTDEIDKQLCASCAEHTATESTRETAEAFAIEHCRLTTQPKPYNPFSHFACSPHEYDIGERASHTPNACLDWSRHNATNCDKLIAELEKGDPVDLAYYTAIRKRCNFLVCNAEPTIAEHFPNY